MYIDGYTPTFINNTIANNSIYGPYTSLGGGIFVDFGTCQGKNNIVYGNSAASGPNTYGNVSFTYSLSVPQLSGTGNITGDPLFVNAAGWDFHLQAGSPCIDAGDPGSPLDPDSTRADIGAYYFDQSGSPVTITLTPHNPPIQIPASGGSFNFDVSVANNAGASQTFQAWILITLPNGSQYGPVLGPVTLTMPAGLSITRTRTQSIPGYAPAGNYIYTGYVGNYPGAIWDSDSFPFTKLTTGDASRVEQWNNEGEALEIAERCVKRCSARAIEFGARPNPFNPKTIISFTLQRDERVLLQVYDLTGRLVATLLNRRLEAGLHKTDWDASSLASGVYICRLQIGVELYSSKLILMK
jgi:hypothetical protein